jgi:glycosyltransferase involved in cell wall biosynthesis
MSKIIVCQYEARHRYAVPRIFNQKGYLAQLITGANFDSYLGKIVNVASKIVPLPSEILRFKERKINEIPLNLVFSADAFSWEEKQLNSFLTKGDVSEWLKARDQLWFSLIGKHVQWDGVDYLYTMMGQNLALLKEAEKRGVKVIVDVFISPMNFRQTLKEKAKLSIIPSILEEKCLDVEEHYKKVFKYSDIILCPSQWVADGVITLDNQFERKICICPYGSSLQFTGDNRKLIEGRIFWAGGDWFRKGLHHLAAAADILKPKYPQLDFRIAGITDANIQKMPIFKNLNFLGKLDSIQMKAEFSTADMFVFPTLTEGMASVVIEAITSGCPIITTRGAGVDALEDGKAGLIIDSVSPDSLSRSIESLLLDRPRLLQMSDECQELAKYYTEDAWGLRLEKVIN